MNIKSIEVTDSPLPPLVMNNENNINDENNIPILNLSDIRKIKISDHNNEIKQLKKNTLRLRGVNPYIISTYDNNNNNINMINNNIKYIKDITFIKKPIKTLYYFCLAILSHIYLLIRWSTERLISISVILFMIFLIILFFIMIAPNLSYIIYIKGKFVVWWCGLGILSSIGLGSGLHTFVLYLGPYVAKKTLAAPIGVSVWSVFLEVYPACLIWGIGTAIGELPPYFIASAARRANKNNNINDMLDTGNDNNNDDNFLEKWKKYLEKIIVKTLKRYGFWGILIFASIPNPLFDLAGLLSGHSGISLITFFSATLIGKAFIKSVLQGLFVIAIFIEHHLNLIVDIIEHIVPMSRGALKRTIEEHKTLFQQDNENITEISSTWLQIAWQIFLIIIIMVFIISIIDATVYSYLRSKHYNNE